MCFALPVPHFGQGFPSKSGHAPTNTAWGCHLVFLALSPNLCQSLCSGHTSVMVWMIYCPGNVSSKSPHIKLSFSLPSARGSQALLSRARSGGRQLGSCLSVVTWWLRWGLVGVGRPPPGRLVSAVCSLTPSGWFTLACSHPGNRLQVNDEKHTGFLGLGAELVASFLLPHFVASQLGDQPRFRDSSCLELLGSHVVKGVRRGGEENWG